MIPNDGYGFVPSVGSLLDSSRDPSNISQVTMEQANQYSEIAFDMSAEATDASDSAIEIPTPLFQRVPTDVTADPDTDTSITADASFNVRWVVQNLLWKDGVQLSAPAGPIDASDAMLYYVIQYGEETSVQNTTRDSFKGSDAMNGGNGVALIAHAGNHDEDELLNVKVAALTRTGGGYVTGNRANTVEKMLLWRYRVDEFGNAYVDPSNTGVDITTEDLLNGTAAAEKIKNWVGHEALIIDSSNQYQKYYEVEIDASGNAATDIKLWAESGFDYNVAALRFTADPSNSILTDFYPGGLTPSQLEADAASVGNRYVVSTSLNALIEDGSACTVQQLSDTQSSGLNSVTSTGQLKNCLVEYDNDIHVVEVSVTTAGRPISSVFCIFDREDDFIASEQSAYPANAPVLKISSIPQADQVATPVPHVAAYGSSADRVVVSGGMDGFLADTDSFTLTQSGNGEFKLRIAFDSSIGDLNGVAAVVVTNQGEMAVDLGEGSTDLTPLELFYPIST